jgi:hypothetical protein
MTERPLNVRIAGPADTAALYDLLTTRLYHENGVFSICPEKVIEEITRATEGRGSVIGIIEENGEIAGCIGIALGQFWYSSDWHAEELFNFVRQEYRNHIGDEKRSFYARDLINFGKWFSEQMKMILNIGIISTERTQAKVRLYQRVLQPVGAFFMHNISVATGPLIIKPSRGNQDGK